MITYNILSDDNGYEIIQKIDADGKEYLIPKDPANSDYQAYLDRDKPKAALSTPIVADEVPSK